MSAQPPPVDIYPAATRFLRDAAMWAADDLRELWATSWYRTSDHNREVGGAPYSQHLVGWALDVAGADQFEFARRAEHTGLIVVRERDHVHVQVFPAGVLQRLQGSI